MHSYVRRQQWSVTESGGAAALQARMAGERADESLIGHAVRDFQGKAAQLASVHGEAPRGRFDPVQREGIGDLVPDLDEDVEPAQAVWAKTDPVQRHAGPEAGVEGDTDRGGLPAQLRSGIESLSGMGMGDVRVHYNSQRPAQLQAHAFTQGSDIHVAPGQERHLLHEAWHVVQQKQGRVEPTMQLQEGVGVNDDPGLEHEADVMGDKALWGA